MAQADEGIVPTATARVALATREVGSLRVALDNSDITPRLTGGGRLREAVVRGRLVEPGGALAEHSLAPCPTGDERMIARRVVVARRSRSLMRALFHPRRPHSASGVVRLRLTVATGVAQMRVWVNGPSACVRHLGRLWPTVSLTRGASHDLRPGTNRIRVVLHHFGLARYDVETFTVKVRCSRFLAAGIAEYRGEAGGRAVRLGGRGARPNTAGTEAARGVAMWLAGPGPGRLYIHPLRKAAQLEIRAGETPDATL